jgi:hypothetical protein
VPSYQARASAGDGQQKLRHRNLSHACAAGGRG